VTPCWPTVLAADVPNKQVPPAELVGQGPTVNRLRTSEARRHCEFGCDAAGGVGRSADAYAPSHDGGWSVEHGRVVAWVVVVGDQIGGSVFGQAGWPR
jgi:hypothetical protein